MYILLWLLFGALVGWLASIVMEKNRNMGLIANIIVGLVGSALGMWLMGVLGLGSVDAFSFIGLLVSVGGAAILIAIITALSRRR
ncbi:MAG: GlsB/YeaQ/YmgE family stress response membrane protein [Firmicutes bacterium]|nr:GlsB/YeaQ/YmgE family stress response membrane protein [Bacillota bacterium]